MTSAPGELRSFILLVTDSFNMAATMNFVDPLRVANYLFGRRYTWSFQAREAGEVLASNGAALRVEALNSEGTRPDYLIISTSWTPEAMASADVLTTVRKWNRRGTRLLTLDTGAFVLGEAGLLTGGKVTVHPEHRQALAELYPAVEVSDTAWVDDRVALSCGGGLAAAACGLDLVEKDWGPTARKRVAAYLLDPWTLDQEQTANEEHNLPSLFAQAEKLMLDHREDLISIPQICKALGVTQRRLEQAFKRQVGVAPVTHYLGLRLEKARELLVQTEMPIMEVSLACGFSSPENFSRRYRLHHGYSPREHRSVGRVAYEFRFADETRGKRSGDALT